MRGYINFFFTLHKNNHTSLILFLCSSTTTSASVSMYSDRMSRAGPALVCRVSTVKLTTPVRRLANMKKMNWLKSMAEMRQKYGDGEDLVSEEMAEVE